MPMQLINAAIMREDLPDGCAHLGGTIGVQIDAGEFVALTMAMAQAMAAHGYASNDREMTAYMQALLDSMLAICVITGIMNKQDVERVS